jgi:hypothetical protein
MRKSDKLKNIEEANKRLLENNIPPHRTSYGGEFGISDGDVRRSDMGIFDDIRGDLNEMPIEDVNEYLDDIINFCNANKV